MGVIGYHHFYSTYLGDIELQTVALRDHLTREGGGDGGGNL